jgi:hypothetical protein
VSFPPFGIPDIRWTKLDAMGGLLCLRKFTYPPKKPWRATIPTFIGSI